MRTAAVSCAAQIADLLPSANDAAHHQINDKAAQVGVDGFPRVCAVRVCDSDVVSVRVFAIVFGDELDDAIGGSINGVAARAAEIRAFMPVQAELLVVFRTRAIALGNAWWAVHRVAQRKFARLFAVRQSTLQQPAEATHDLSPQNVQFSGVLCHAFAKFAHAFSSVQNLVQRRNGQQDVAVVYRRWRCLER